MAMEKTRILITDDSAFMRSAIRKLVQTADDMEVVASARNGIEAIELAKKHQPHIITLDIEMPEMDGLTALPQLRRVCKATILMISSLTQAGSHATLTAMRLGAADFITKDQSQISLDTDSIESQLLVKIRHLARANRRSDRDAAAAPPSKPSGDVLPRSTRLISIASSTGGPPVLEQLVEALPAGLSCPVVIAQHMPAVFTQAMAERLDKIGSVTVEHGRHGQRLEPGHVYVAPGAMHSRVRSGVGRGMWLEVSEKPEDLLYRPSADELLRSSAEVCGDALLGIVLTGMGEDGLLGARVLRDRGGRLIAQDHASCVVYGMPKAVVQAGLVDAVLSPAGIIEVLKSPSLSQSSRAKIA
jgi:two-component system chemotaxis response regulator CheB